MKWLLLLVVVWCGVWLWKHQRKAAQIARDAAASRPAPPPPAPNVPAHMVACAHCGLHLPLHEAITAPGGHYCCDAHRTAREG